MCAAVWPAGAQQATSRSLPHKDPTVATVLSVIIPGGGQAYATRYGKAAIIFAGTAAGVAIAIDAANSTCTGNDTCNHHSVQTIGIVTAALIWGYGWATAAGDARLHNNQMLLNTSLAPVLDRRNGRLLAGLRLAIR
jgi:hypothetical protein